MDLSSILALLGGKQNKHSLPPQENPCACNYPKEAGFVADSPVAQQNSNNQGQGLQSILPLLMAMGGGGKGGLLGGVLKKTPSTEDESKIETTNAVKNDQPTQNNASTNDLLMQLLSKIKS